MRGRSTRDHRRRRSGVERDPLQFAARERLVDVVTFPPQPASTGREYELHVTLAQCRRRLGHRVERARPERTRCHLPMSDGTTSPVSFELHSDYGGDHHGWDQATLALRRLERVPAVVPTARRRGRSSRWSRSSPSSLLVLARGRAAVALLIVLAVSKGLVWSSIVPPLEAPDEPAHVAYAQFMAEAHRLPKRNVAQLGLPSNQFYSPQLTAWWPPCTRTARPPATARTSRPEVTRSAVEQADEQSPEANGNGAAAGYPPVYYLPAALLYAVTPGSLLHQIEVMRWWSIALGALAGVLDVADRTAAVPAPRGRRDRACSRMRLAPELSQQTASVNNDALAIAAGAASLLVAIELLRPAGINGRAGLCASEAPRSESRMFKSFGVVVAPVLSSGGLLGRLRTLAPSGRRCRARSRRPSAAWR